MSGKLFGPAHKLTELWSNCFVLRNSADFNAMRRSSLGAWGILVGSHRSLAYDFHVSSEGYKI